MDYFLPTPKGRIFYINGPIKTIWNHIMDSSSPWKLPLSLLLMSSVAWGAARWMCQFPWLAHQYPVWRPGRDPLISPRSELLSGPQTLASTALRDSRTERGSCPGRTREIREHQARSDFGWFREDGNYNSEEYKRVMTRAGFGPNKSTVSRELKISEYV